MTIAEAKLNLGIAAANAWDRDSVGFREADDALNDANRAVVDAYLQEHDGLCWLGNINLCLPPYLYMRLSPSESVAMWQHDGSNIVYNFGASFVVPQWDEQLEALIVAYNGNATTPANRRMLDELFDRVTDLGGAFLLKQPVKPNAFRLGI